MHPARHADAAESFAPSDGIRLVAELGGQRVRHLGAPAYKAVNLFLDVDKRWFHDAVSISPLPAPRKPERGNQTAATGGPLNAVAEKIRGDAAPIGPSAIPA